MVAFRRDGFTRRPRAGGTVKFRGPVLYDKVNPQDTLKDIIDVLEIGVTGELRENLSLAVQTMTARGGGITPARPSRPLSTAATDRCTGLQILQQQKNKAGQQPGKDLQAEHLDLLRLWSTVVGQRV